MISPDLFHPVLRLRLEASRRVAPSDRADFAAAISAGHPPRLGTSGAANAYIVLVGSEFGVPGREDRPKYSPLTMGEDGWADLWRLRIGEPNPHFDERWAHLRRNTELWNRLYNWLPDVVPNQAMAHSMFAWVNLSVTAGGADLGTSASHRDGLIRHLAPFLDVAHTRVVAGTNEPVMRQLHAWCSERNAASLPVR